MDLWSNVSDNKNPCCVGLSTPNCYRSQWCLEELCCAHSFQQGSQSGVGSLLIAGASSFIFAMKLWFMGLYDNGLIIAEVKQLSTFPVHKILYTNNEDRIIMPVNQTSWIWTEMWFVTSSSHLKSGMFSLRILHYLALNGETATNLYCAAEVAEIWCHFKLLRSVSCCSEPPITSWPVQLYCTLAVFCFLGSILIW